MNGDSSMNNTDMLRFNFSDRSSERNSFDAYLKETSQRVLWIYGESGIGKSFFAKNCAKIQTQYEMIYLKNEENQDVNHVIYQLIQELQIKFNNSFILFCQKNYKGLKLLASDIISQTKIADLKSLEFFKDILKKNPYFVDEDNTIYELTNILQQYTQKILETKRLLIVIDNFGQCDACSIENLLKYVKRNIQNPNCKFVFISTDLKDDTKVNRYEINTELELQTKKIELKKIPSKDLFINMLPDVFDKSNLNQDDIDKIYVYCNGIPENLISLLINLDKKHGIIYSEKSISFIRDSLLSYMSSTSNPSIQYKNYDFYEQIIILCLVCLDVPLNINLLIALCDRYSRERLSYVSLASEQWLNYIFKLSPRPVQIVQTKQGMYIQMEHNLARDAALLYFRENNMYQYSCDTIYNLLIDDLKNIFEKYVDNVLRQQILATLAYHAERILWEKINFSCGEIFANEGNYYQANKYFERLIENENYRRLNFENLLIVGNTFYEVGSYEYAKKIFADIDFSKVENLYQYHILYGKILIMTRNDKEALDEFNKAIEVALPQSNDKVYAEYMKHLVMIQNPTLEAQAYSIYKPLVERIVKAYKEKNYSALYLQSNAKVLRCCYDYYYNEEALKLYNIAEVIADYFKDEIEKAKIWHNKGFEYIRQDNLKKGIEYFEKSENILERTRLHDAAYSLNNLAICKMFQQQYTEAIDYLKRALLYEKSYYLRLTATTMLMQCYRLTKNDAYLTRKDALYDELKIHKDSAIIRKITMNLIICEMEDHNEQNARKLLRGIKNLVPNSSSEYRAEKIMASLEARPFEANQILTNSSFVKSSFFTIMEFEPWFITLSHD